MAERYAFIEQLNVEYRVQVAELFHAKCIESVAANNPIIEPAAVMYLGEFTRCFWEAPDDRVRNMIEHKDMHTQHVRLFLKNVVINSHNPRGPWNMSLVDTIGGLHDIYRPEQARRWHTFSDRDSVKHAHEGARLVRAAGMPWERYGFNVEQLARPIETHSDRWLVTDDPYSQAIQDGDKLALLYWFKAIANVDRQQPWDGTSEITPEILESFLNNEVTDNALARTPADRIVNRLSWWYGFHFPVSRELALEHNVLKGPMDALAQAMDTVPEQILERVDQWRTNPHGK